MSKRSKRSNHNGNHKNGEVYIPPASRSRENMSEYSRSLSGEGYAQQRRKRTRRKKILVGVAVGLCALIFAGAAAAFGYVSYINGQLHKNIDDSTALEAVLTDRDKAEDPFYIVLMGTDGRVEGEADRSDSLILVRVDPANKSATMVSIPRDTRVQLEGYGYQKINAAYAYGGSAMTVQAVSDFAGVDIAHYVEVDFSGFKEIVDALGGVEVDVPMDIDDPLAEGPAISAGLQVLDGEQALVFCRSRAYAIGDYQRQANQRTFLQALAKQLLASDPATLLSAVNSIAATVTTDMNVEDIYEIALSMRGMQESDIHTYTVPSASQTIDGISYVIADETAWAEMMEIIDAGGFPDEQVEDLSGVVPDSYKATDSDTATTDTTTTVTPSQYSITVRNGGGIEGSASGVATELENAGYTIAETGNADSFVYDETLVVYADDSSLAAANDIVSRLGYGRTVASEGRYSFDGDILVVVGTDWG